MKQLFPLFIFFCFSFLISSMDRVKEDIVISHIFPKHIQDNPGTCSHNTICALALVNKKWNEFIKNTAIQRRRYLAFTQEYTSLHTTHKEIYQQQVWHKNNTAYAYWMKIKDKEKLFCLTYFDGNNKISTKEYKDTSLTIPIFKDYLPFFNSQGDACCHAWHEKNISCRCVELRLSVNTTKLVNIVTCYLNLNCQEIEQFNSFQYFLRIQSTQPSAINLNKIKPSSIKNHPILLKAFINSQHVEEINQEKIYHLDGVTIDQNYLLQGSFPTQWWRNTVAQNCIKKQP